ncbi:MAG: UDP-N-acetylmuramate dehydrogenase [Candidatus Magasanikbacteria bacterium]
MDSTYQKLNKFGKVRCDEPLSQHTTVKCGGCADYLIFIDDREDLVNLLTELDQSGIPYKLLGHGGNTLASDSGYSGVVIKNETNGLEVSENKLHADSGADITKAAQHSMFKNLSGFEWGVGALGSVGGNVYHNEKILDRRLAPIVDKAETYKDGSVVTYSRGECEFGSDESVFQRPGMVITKVIFKLSQQQSDPEQSMKYINHKNKNLPAVLPCVGPVFKHITEDIDIDRFDKEERREKFKEKGEAKPEWLIEKLDIELENNTAEKHDKNPNFIVNQDNTSSREIMDLIEKIEYKVYDRYGVELERKMQTIGF